MHDPVIVREGQVFELGERDEELLSDRHFVMGTDAIFCHGSFHRGRRSSLGHRCILHRRFRARRQEIYVLFFLT
jgi:hypothetical protein